VTAALTPSLSEEPAGAPSSARLELLSSLSTYLQECGETEKAELAHKLHDELGGLLTAAKMDLSWIQSRIDSKSPLIPRLAQLGAVLDEAMDLKRHLVEELRPSLLEHFGFATAVRAHIETVCSKHGLRYEVTVEEEGAPALGKSESIALFRVVQAALQNVVDHAQAKSIHLGIDSKPDALHVTLSDDGIGMGSARLHASESMGIAGMRHRVAALGGTIEFIVADGGGTTVQARILRRPARAATPD